MTWHIQYTRTFLKEMARLPAPVRGRVEAIAFGEAIQEDPFLAGKAQKLVGYKTFYKIRVGDYRVGVHIDIENEVIEFQRVLHRREIYRNFP
ncbi:MAG: type II toxin-antitoxin system RelE/ParE family toxin [Anaerolineae bacterium]|nr:type II toxin-antitoxin system RelE/ParE family toxin [Anaerolineae bacterium]